MENNKTNAIVRYSNAPFIHKLYGTLYDVIPVVTLHTNLIGVVHGKRIATC